MLVHYDPALPIILECDASRKGVGAVLSHQFSDGTERPIGFASRSLCPAETRYSQIDLEALAVIFGVTKFKKYLLGRSFMIRSDHKPLLYLFGDQKPIPHLASARLQRWALLLSAYQYQWEFRKGSQLSNADALSRSPLEERPSAVPLCPDTIQLITVLEQGLVTVEKVKQFTARDPVLSQVLRFCLSGWPEKCTEPNLLPFSRRSVELTSHDGCVLWGGRVVIPSQLRKLVLLQLHDTHPGISRMKSIARSYFWWPGMDAEIEDLGRSCASCCQLRNNPPPAPLHQWPWPSSPFARVHVDHAGPFMGHYFFILVDAHSKWLEAEIVSSTSSKQTIQSLRKIFATHGIPQQIVSDNATTFTSGEFQEFVKNNGITHTPSAPYHPSTNGLEERAVQSLKQALLKMTGDLQTRLSRFLFTYRNTPHPTTGRSPSEMLFGRRLRSRWDLLLPDVSKRVTQQQENQKFYHDTHARDRGSLQKNQLVLSRGYRGRKWEPGQVLEKTSSHSYDVLVDGKVVSRHQDQLLSKETPPSSPDPPVSLPSQQEPPTPSPSPSPTLSPAAPLPLHLPASPSPPSPSTPSPPSCCGVRREFVDSQNGCSRTSFCKLSVLLCLCFLCFTKWVFRSCFVFHQVGVLRVCVLPSVCFTLCLCLPSVFLFLLYL